jgi:hypothetical protein
VIGVALFVPDLVPMLAAGGVRLLEHALGVTLPRGRLDPSLGLLGGVVALALLTEYSVHAVARGRPTAAVAVAPPPRDAAGTRRLIRAARGLGAVGLGLGLLFASMVVKIGWAKQQTHALCAGIVVGEPVEELTAKARRRGLVVWSSPEGKDIDGRPRPAMLMAWEGVAFGRWFCDVEHAQGRVLSRRTAFLG